MENRQLQIQRLHQRIQQYRLTEQQQAQLQRNHIEMKLMIETKFANSTANKHYRFPTQEADRCKDVEEDECGRVYNLNGQNSKDWQRIVHSSLSPHRKTLKYESRSGRREGKPTDITIQSLVGLTKKVNALAKRIKTEADRSNSKQNHMPRSPVYSAIKKLPGKIIKNNQRSDGKLLKSEKERERDLIKIEQEVRNKHRHILTESQLNSSIGPILDIIPLTAKNKNNMSYDFNRTHQIANISRLAEDTPMENINDIYNRPQPSHRKPRKSQLPTQKMFNETQMKLLTNRISREGKSIKTNYRLIIESEGPIQNKFSNKRMYTNR